MQVSDAGNHRGPLGWFRFDADFTTSIGRSVIFDGPSSDFGRWVKLLVLLARLDGHAIDLDDEATCAYVTRCLEFADRASLAAFVVRMSALGLVFYNEETCTISERQVSESAELIFKRHAAGVKSGRSRAARTKGDRVKETAGRKALPSNNAPTMPQQCSNNAPTVFEQCPNSVRTQLEPYTYTYTSTEEHKDKSVGGRVPDATGRATFSPPSREEVAAYGSEYAGGRGLAPFDAASFAEDFCDYFAAQGWRLSNGNRMRDWRRAAARWIRSDAAKASASRVEEGLYGLVE